MIGTDVYRRWTLGYNSSNIGPSLLVVPQGHEGRCYGKVMWSV